MNELAVKAQRVQVGEYHERFWFDITMLMGKISYKISNKENIDTTMIQLIMMILQVAICFDVDLDNAWKNWRKKAYRKVYRRPIQQRILQP